MDDYPICLPKSKENAILGHYHSNAAAGHYGIIATIKRILQKYWVPRPTIMVTKFIATCLQCQRKMQSPLSTLKTHRKESVYRPKLTQGCSLYIAYKTNTEVRVSTGSGSAPILTKLGVDIRLYASVHQ